MSDTTRIVLIATGVALLVVVLVPALFMGGMMGTMMGGGAGWWMVGLPVLILLIGGLILGLSLRGR